MVHIKPIYGPYTVIFSSAEGVGYDIVELFAASRKASINQWNMVMPTISII